MVLNIVTFLILLIKLTIVVSFQPYLDTNIDYAASPIDMQNLIKVETQLVFKFLRVLKNHEVQDQPKGSGGITSTNFSTLIDYLEDFESTLVADLDMDLAHFERLSQRSVIDLSGFALDASKHPFKTYRTIRRFVVKLDKLLELHNNDNTGISQLIKLYKNLQPFPTELDFEVSTLSILRLNQVYKMSIKDFLTGKLGSLETNCSLSHEHLLEIGKVASTNKFYSQAVDFFAFALWKTIQMENFPAASEPWALLQEAITMHDEKIKGSIDADDIQPDSGPLFFNDLLYNITHTNFKNRIPVRLDTLMIPFANHSSDDPLIQGIKQAYAFEQLCRGESLQKPLEHSNLRCYRTSKSHPAFILSPLKVEVHHEDPLVLQYYDVISEVDIEKLKDEVKGEMRMSRTVKSEDKILGVTNRFRTSSNSWVVDFNHPKFMNLLRRIGRILKVNVLKSTSTENMQVAAYSPGGHYIHHTDAVFEEEMLKKLDPSEFLRGDRIITFMIYLSNVESGGSTVFSQLKLSIKPVKGSAVVWHNLHPDGSIDRRTLHGGCSVAYGIKWIANKWIRNDDQMFIKKCPAARSTTWKLDV